MNKSLEKGICCLCGNEYTGAGNNPFPLCTEGNDASYCCDKCNKELVIPARVKLSKGECD